MPPTSRPIFFDATGHRWQRVRASVGILVVLLGGLTAWTAPGAFAPTWWPSENKGVGYPRHLEDEGKLDELPVLSADGGDAFNRVLAVDTSADPVVLKDPFSGEVLRELDDDEIAEVGDNEFVIDEFGKVPDHQLMLTFDDGPDATYTPELLNLLSREGVPATFFVLGQNVVKHQEILRRIVREGHMVGNHTMRHIDFAKNSDARDREELVGTDRTLRAVAGYGSRLFRIPRGDPYANATAVLQAQQLGYVHVNYDLDTLDWDYGPGEEIPVPELDGEGHVVLMHDAGGDRSGTLAMLAQFIDDAKAQGYTFSTMAPILPPEYTPAHDVAPTVADRATLAALSAVWVAPGYLVGWLFWFGIVSLTVMSLLYVVLALANHRRQRRRGPRAEGPLPFVSVVLPVFNEEPVVAKTLAALRASDYPAFEVIVVNDGSTDNTLQVLREAARDWPQLRVVDQPNAGKAAASNHGFALARGEVVVTLDGDTVFEPGTIRMLAQHFVGPDGAGVGAVAGHVKVGNRRNLLTAWQSLEYISGICVTRMAEGLVGAISIVPGACAGWRRDAVLRAGGYSHDTMAEDADLTLSIHRLGYQVVQENAAVAWTEAPYTVRGLARQRLRWTYGNIQTLTKHRGMLLRPRYGVLGLVTMPYTLLSVLIPLLFGPFTILVAALSISSGNWQSIALFAAFVTGMHLLISAVALWLVREKTWHLAIVPIYRLIYEPLRFYLLYASLVRALKGRVMGWYKPERMNTVSLPVPALAPARSGVAGA
ncbi:bifunctional polysaccharide deacetylase/glycosyltransferase family 2 protein [Georgenia ruanii]|uniref:Glycosyltransferase n=1 Tax=Georgenia ruanii TaxID=348442 RepID=A0A7J9UY59_9MICO|nr:bifunctional polysaccharide deacetylase/glycosyltransferase family 2 protein [Georgenia ruanii]MPV88614.1 glycosyltransferase [Georgenia ruanii]